MSSHVFLTRYHLDDPFQNTDITAEAHSGGSASLIFCKRPVNLEERKNDFIRHCHYCDAWIADAHSYFS